MFPIFCKRRNENVALEFRTHVEMFFGMDFFHALLHVAFSFAILSMAFKLLSELKFLLFADFYITLLFNDKISFVKIRKSC